MSQLRSAQRTRPAQPTPARHGQHVSKRVPTASVGDEAKLQEEMGRQGALAHEAKMLGEGGNWGRRKTQRFNVWRGVIWVLYGFYHTEVFGIRIHVSGVRMGSM